MGRVRITRPFVLLALAVLMAPRIEASRTSVWESSPPAAVIAKADATSALPSLAPAAQLDISALANAEAAEPPLFNLGDVILADTAAADAEHFDLGPLTLVDLNLLRGPPPSYPETRVGGFELLPPFRVGASPSLSLWSRQACGFSCREVASDSREDPWGLESGATFGAIDRRDRGVSAVPPSYTAQEKAAAAQRLVGCLAFGGGAAWTAFSGGALGGVLGGFALMSSGGATCFGKESPIGMVVRETSDAAAKSQGVQMTPAVAQQQAANNAAVEGAITTGLISYGAIAPQAPATGVRTDGPPAPVMRKPSPAPADSPYVTRFDSRFPGRPDPEWSIDTRAFATGEPTAAGGIRNRTEFWTEWLRRHPETISKGNRFLIEKKGLSPRVDDHWISYFPEHAPYARETLFHHHVDQGPYAVPVPSSTHPGSGGPFHAP